MKCACGNEARYISEDALFTCSLCPLTQRKDAVRISDVPALLAWARAHLGQRSLRDAGFSDKSCSPEMLRDIVGKCTGRRFVYLQLDNAADT